MPKLADRLASPFLDGRRTRLFDWHAEVGRVAESGCMSARRPMKRSKSPSCQALIADVRSGSMTRRREARHPP
jgi:hypothetical protein